MKGKNCFRCVNYHSCGAYAVAFGLGATLACFCPPGFILFLAAVIITALGIVVARH